MRMSLGVVALVACVASCGDSVTPDAVVALRVVSPVAMPFHGPGGPGAETIFINLRWTVVVESGDGATSRVVAVRTQLTESRSGRVLVSESLPAQELPPHGELRLDEQASGLFPSESSQGDWAGVTTVKLVLGSGAEQTLTAAFSIP